MLQFLLEVTRLIHVWLSNDEVESQWMAVLETETVFKELQLHFGDSLNVESADQLFQVVDKVLDSSDEMLNTWADLPLVTAVYPEQLHIVETPSSIFFNGVPLYGGQGVRGLVTLCISCPTAVVTLLPSVDMMKEGSLSAVKCRSHEFRSRVMNVILVRQIPITGVVEKSHGKG
ncbi:Protein saal1 [Desmophyllum pertusum]|uniref:Protein saal1 n=1 Tax=Desmophyllum pertusum TaxID=174260 RepID=A0A9X0D9V9_9CNID|nr:Protein saal1 [Desmophyllum pertusum]